MLNREVFAKVGSELLEMKPCKDISVEYENQGSKVALKAGAGFENATLAAQIKLPQATVEISTAEKDSLKVSPNLAKFDSKLTVFPLDNKRFDFQITKRCQKTGAQFTLGYNSAEARPKLEVLPALRFGAAALSGKINFDGLEKPSGMLCVARGNFNARASYNVVKDELRTGAFYNIPSVKALRNVGVGAILGFQEPKKLQNAILCCKMSLGEGEMSALVPVIEDAEFSPSVQLRTISAFAVKGAAGKIASSLEFKDSKFAMKNALQIQCSRCKNNKVSVLVEDRKKLTAVYERAITRFESFDAKVKLSLTQEKNEERKLGFCIAINQK